MEKRAVIICVIFLLLTSICQANQQDLPNLENLNKSYCCITDGSSVGSGAIININSEKYILTCFHVVENFYYKSHYNKLNEAEKIKLCAIFYNRQVIETAIVKIDPLHDLALLKPANGFIFPETIIGISTDSFVAPKEVKFGSKIYKIGTPMAMFDVPAEGLVGIETLLDDDNMPIMLMQILSINSWPGDSGCPAFSREGLFVGLIFVGTPYDVVGLIPATTIQKSFAWMFSKEQTGRSGLTLIDDYEGNIVVLKSGNNLIRVGDIINKIENMRIKKAFESKGFTGSALFEIIVYSFQKGDALDIEIQRENTADPIEVKLIVQ